MRARLRSWLVSVLADALREAEAKASRDKFSGRIRDLTESTERLKHDVRALRMAGSVGGPVNSAARLARRKAI